MIVAFVVFVVVLVVVFGIFYAAVIRPEDEQREAIRRRLTGGAGGVKASRLSSLLKSAQDVTAVPVIDRLLAPLHAVTAPLARRLEHADLRLTVGALLATACIASLVAYVIGYVLSGYHWVALPVAGAALWVPFAVVRVKANQRIRTFEDQFPEAIDLITRALRAGHAFTGALSMVAEEAPQPVGGEFRKLYDAQNFGRPLPDAMREFARRIPVLDAKFFVTAVLTQRESGGNLSEVLDNLARVIRERFKVKRQIRVVSAHGRITGAVLMSLPPFLAVSFMVISPGHLQTMTGDVLGWWMIGGAVFLQLTGSLFIRRLVNIEY
jgi:tight adherence protein B